MPDINQQINIIATFQNKLQGMNKALTTLDKLKEAGVLNNKEYNKSISLLEDSDKNLFSIAKKMQKFDKETKKGTKDLNRMGSAAKTLSITLPLMFGFQQASQSIQSLIKPAMDLVGVQQTYNDFLAIKYLPTALEQLDTVLATGDAWSEQSEAQRKMEGDMLLLAQRTSDFVTYAAQMATTLGAIGEIIPTIDLAPLGVGITITGREMGAAAGVVMAVTGGLVAMSTEAGRTTALFSGFGAAVAMEGTDKLSAFLIQVQKSVSTGGLPTFGDDVNSAKDKTQTFGEKVANLWEGLKNINNKGEDWLVDILSKLNGANPDDIKKTLEELKKGPWNIPITITTSLLGGMSWIWDIIKNIGKKAISAGASLGGIMGLPMFEKGGVMPYTGLAVLHAGETITPAGQGINSSPVFNITVNGSNMNARDLAEQISKQWATQFERISKSRGMI